MEHYIDNLDKISDVIKKDLLFAEESESIEIVLEKMMSDSKNEIIVLNEIKEKPTIDDIAGIATIKDISNYILKEKNFKGKIGSIVRRNIRTIDSESTMYDLKILLKKSNLNELLLVEKDEIIGIITPSVLFEYQNFEREEVQMQLKFVLSNLHEAVCVLNSSGIVTFWNESAEKLYRVKKKDIIGQSLGKFFPNALLLKVLKENKAFENLNHEPSEGSNVVISARPIRYKGKLIGAVSTDRDIKEVRNLYRELNVEKKRVEKLKREMKEITQEKYYFGKVMGKSKGLTDAIRLAKQVARTDASVLVTGESGTGKEVFSRAIHNESERTGNFIPVNCSAIPANLLESELFGYVEGAFTGAHKKGRAGKFELADKGTLFLDEIGDMPLIMQAKLLRVLQDGIVNRIGSEEYMEVNARIIAATNKDLIELMERGEFREDLYYRLNVVSLVIPPLRERKEDIPDLINSFMREFSEKNDMEDIEITPEAMKILTEYKWNGNVREVRNTVERLVILSRNNKIDIGDLPQDIVQDTNNYSFEGLNIEDDFDLKKTVEEYEKNVIIKALETTGGNKVQAADLLNIKRATLYYKINLYDIDSYMSDD